MFLYKCQEVFLLMKTMLNSVIINSIIILYIEYEGVCFG